MRDDFYDWHLRTSYDDILKNKGHCIIAHGVNAKGKFNAGLAKQIRKAYPECYERYMQAYENKALRLGEIIWYEHPSGLRIANCVTQQTYGYHGVHANLHAIGKCAMELERYMVMWNRPLHIPVIGSNLGGLNAVEVYQLFCRTFRKLDVTVYIRNRE